MNYYKVSMGIAALIVFLAVTSAPMSVWAGTPGGGSNTSTKAYTCKSGAKVQGSKGCKENGGSK